ILGPELIQETTEKIVQIKQGMQAARDQQKSYADLKPLGWHLEEIHMTLAHLEKKQTRLRLYTKSFEETVHTERGNGVAITKRRRQDFHIDGVRDLMTVSECRRLKVALEDST
nr:reverse transcriptase domain-containing protein [Tanacetum cinerariifolium]